MTRRKLFRFSSTSDEYFDVVVSASDERSARLIAWQYFTEVRPDYLDYHLDASELSLRDVQTDLIDLRG